MNIQNEIGILYNNNRPGGFSLKQPLYLSSYDLEVLYRAKDMLTKDISRHITIMDLSRELGINEFKLKHGFKQIFGSGIYSYQLMIRMERAKELLETTERCIKDIARLVGYRSSSSFIAAFKKMYKISPASWKRKERNQKTPD